jgi:hypothetical protein
MVDGEIAVTPKVVGAPTVSEQRSGGAVPGSVQIMDVIPNGCTAKSNQPHNSNTQPGWVHAEGRVDCGSGNYQDTMYIDGLLTRDRWYGEEQVDYKEQRKGISNWINVTNTFDCDSGATHTYHNYNYSESTRSGLVYTANTSNSNRFTCN